MCKSALFMVLLLVSTGLSVQAQYKYTPADGCPVGFGAEVNAQAISRQTSDSHENEVDSIPLELSFEQTGAAGIVSAEIVVHGLSGTGGILPAKEAAKSDKTQVFHLERVAAAKDLQHSEVFVTKMAVVRWAEITKLKYADGSEWKTTSASRCRAMPPLFRLVDAPATNHP